MADPKGIYNSPSNPGLAQPILNMWQPAFAVSQQQKKEEEARKNQKAAAQQKAVESNQEFGEELFKDKFNSYTTQINDYKNSRLKDLRDKYNKVNFEYSASGQGIPIEVKQDLERNLQEFKDSYEQIETAYKYTDNILKQAAKDTSGIYNLNALREVLMDIPTKEDGTIDFTRYNERFTEANLKKNATSILNASKVAESFMKTVAESKLSNVKALGNGQHDDVKEVAKGLKLFQQPDGSMGYENPKTGLPELDDSPAALALARKDEHMNMLIEAKVANGEAESPMEAYQQVIHNQAYLQKDIDRRGSIKTDKEDKKGSGYSAPKPRVQTRFNTIHRALTNYDTDALAQMFDASGMVDIEFKGNEYGPGESIPDRIEIRRKERYDKNKHGFMTPDSDGYVSLSQSIDISTDRKKREAYFKINKFINSGKDRASTEVVSNDDIQMYINERDKQEKEKKNEDPLGLYPFEEEVVNPEGESLY
jgi:hypothetical protein